MAYKWDSSGSLMTYVNIYPRHLLIWSTMSTHDLIYIDLHIHIWNVISQCWVSTPLSHIWSTTLTTFDPPQYLQKKVREKSRECHNHKPQSFPDPKRKRKPTNPNKHKSKKLTKSTKISSLFPKWGNHNTKKTEKHKNKMTHGKTCHKSPRRINHKATKSKTNTGTTALEQSVE